MAVVKVSDAIVYPRAMVIHAKNTSITIPTVMGSGRLVILAHPAISWTTCELLDLVSVHMSIRFP